MAIDLSKTIYQRLEDGDYTILVKDWSLETATNASKDEYIKLTSIIQGTGRPVNINLFERSLGITLGNVSEYLNVSELSVAEVLNAMVNKEFPAYHETVQVDGKTYYNWFICSKPQNKQTASASTEPVVEIAVFN